MSQPQLKVLQQIATASSFPSLELLEQLSGFDKWLQQELRKGGTAQHELVKLIYDAASNSLQKMSDICSDDLQILHPDQSFGLIHLLSLCDTCIEHCRKEGVTLMHDTKSQIMQTGKQLRTHCRHLLSTVL